MIHLLDGVPDRVRALMLIAYVISIIGIAGFLSFLGAQRARTQSHDQFDIPQPLSSAVKGAKVRIGRRVNAIAQDVQSMRDGENDGWATVRPAEDPDLLDLPAPGTWVQAATPAQAMSQLPPPRTPGVAPRPTAPPRTPPPPMPPPVSDDGWGSPGPDWGAPPTGFGTPAGNDDGW